MKQTRSNWVLNALLYHNFLMSGTLGVTKYNTVHLFPVSELYPIAQLARILQHRKQVQVAYTSARNFPVLFGVI